MVCNKIGIREVRSDMTEWQ